MLRVPVFLWVSYDKTFIHDSVLIFHWLIYQQWAGRILCVFLYSCLIKYLFSKYVLQVCYFHFYYLNNNFHRWVMEIFRNDPQSVEYENSINSVSVVKKCSGYFFSWSVLSILLMMPPSSLRWFSQVWDLGLHSCFCKLTSNLMLSLMRVFSVWNCLYFIKVKLICESSTLIPLVFFLINSNYPCGERFLVIVLFGILRTEF